MTELNFQRGKSFAEVSRAITETTVTEDENGERIAKSAGTSERSNLHAPERHPATGARAVAQAVAEQPLSNNDPQLLEYLRAHTDDLSDEQRETLQELERRSAMNPEEAQAQ